MVVHQQDDERAGLGVVDRRVDGIEIGGRQLTMGDERPAGIAPRAVDEHEVQPRAPLDADPLTTRDQLRDVVAESIVIPGDDDQALRSAEVGEHGHEPLELGCGAVLGDVARDHGDIDALAGESLGERSTTLLESATCTEVQVGEMNEALCVHEGTVIDADHDPITPM